MRSLRLCDSCDSKNLVAKKIFHSILIIEPDAIFATVRFLQLQIFGRQKKYYLTWIPKDYIHIDLSIEFMLIYYINDLLGLMFADYTILAWSGRHFYRCLMRESKIIWWNFSWMFPIKYTFSRVGVKYVFSLPTLNEH